jgi:molecular chaperone DnaK
VPQIEVTFDIDANGILTVTARDKATGKQQDIRITASSGLSKEEIERMKREAQEHAAEDKKRREEIELRNQGDQLVYQTEKQLQELGDKIPAEHRTRIEQAKERLQDAIKNNPSDIRPAMDALTKAWNDASAVMYQATSATAGGSSGGSSGGDSSTPGVEDAEFTVVDDK